MTPTQTRPVDAVTVRQRRFPRWLPWALGVAVLAAVALILFLRQSGQPRTLVLGSRTVVGAGPELDIHPALSPDGRMMAYTSVGSAPPRLVVQQTDGGNPVVVSQTGFGGMFSPDGTRLLALTPRGLEVMPALGGQSRVVAATDEWGNWSPDGRSIVYPRGDTLFVQVVDSSRATAIANGRDLHSPAWSSDGRWIAYVEGNSLFHRNGNLGASSIRVVSSEGGAPIEVTRERSLNTSPLWLPGRRTLLFISDREGGRDIYQVELTSRGAPSAAAGANHHRPRRGMDQHLGRRPPAGLVPVPGIQQRLVAPDSGPGFSPDVSRNPGHDRNPEYREPGGLARWRVALLRCGSGRELRHLSPASCRWADGATDH